MHHQCRQDRRPRHAAPEEPLRMQPRRESPRANLARRRCRRDHLGIRLHHHAKATPRQRDRHVGVGHRIATGRREPAAGELQHIRPPESRLEHGPLRHRRTSRRTCRRPRLPPPGVGGHVNSPPPDGTSHARRHNVITVVGRHPQRHDSPHFIILESLHRQIGPAFRGPPAGGQNMHYIGRTRRHTKIDAAHQARPGGRLHEPHLLADVPRVGVFATEGDHDLTVVRPVLQNADERFLHGRGVGRSGNDDRQPRRSHEVKCVRHRQPPRPSGHSHERSRGTAPARTISPATALFQKLDLTWMPLGHAGAVRALACPRPSPRRLDQAAARCGCSSVNRFTVCSISPSAS